MKEARIRKGGMEAGTSQEAEEKGKGSEVFKLAIGQGSDGHLI